MIPNFAVTEEMKQRQRTISDKLNLEVIDRKNAENRRDYIFDLHTTDLYDIFKHNATQSGSCASARVHTCHVSIIVDIHDIHERKNGNREYRVHNFVAGRKVYRSYTISLDPGIRTL